MEPVPVADRRRDYEAAETHAVDVAERWTEAKAGRRMTPGLDREMDEAERNLLRAKRRLERVERKGSRCP